MSASLIPSPSKAPLAGVQRAHLGEIRVPQLALLHHASAQLTASNQHEAPAEPKKHATTSGQRSPSVGYVADVCAAQRLAKGTIV